MEKPLLNAVWKSYGVVRGELDFHVFVDNVMAAATFIDSSSGVQEWDINSGGHQLLGARDGGQARTSSSISSTTTTHTGTSNSITTYSKRRGKRAPGISAEDAEALLAEAEELATKRAADALAGRAGRDLANAKLTGHKHQVLKHRQETMRMKQPELLLPRIGTYGSYGNRGSPDPVRHLYGRGNLSGVLNPFRIL